jgi:hypothetical protein
MDINYIILNLVTTQMANLKKLGRVEIRCDSSLEAEVREKIVKNLSGAFFSHQGKYLWLGTDELTAIERFTHLLTSCTNT